MIAFEYTKLPGGAWTIEIVKRTGSLILKITRKAFSNEIVLIQNFWTQCQSIFKINNIILCNVEKA